MKSAALAGGVAVALVPLAAANGGYFPTSWGWATLAYAWVAILAILLSRTFVLDRYGVSLLAALALYATWIWLSAAWSRDLPATILEGERALVYVSGAAALLLVARGRTAALLGGTLGGVVLVCLYALGTRLFPGRLGAFDSAAGYRLQTPIGYWNSLGLFAVLGLLLALGFAARAVSPAARAAAAASLAPLAATLYFTFSRGAWIALFVALLFLVALDARRLQLLAVAVAVVPAPAVAVWLAWNASALNTQGATLAAAQRAGHRFAAELAALAVLAAFLAAAVAVVERRWRPAAALRLCFAGAAVAVVLAGIGAAWSQWGAPPTLVARGWHAFVAPPPPAGANLNSRLFHLSGTRRILTWRSAVHEFRSAPAGGGGAGSFESWWLAHRPEADQVRDAHSLYLETLGELGLVGLVLLALVLVVVLGSAVAGRRRPLVPAAAAAFVAWAIHAAADWDWELTGVTLAAFSCAVACTVRDGGVTRPTLRTRAFAAAAAACVAGFAVVVVIGNQALASASAALADGNYARAQSAAQRASGWAPWAAEPWLIRGQIDAFARDRPGAVADLRRALRLEPRSYLAWYALAQVETGDDRAHAAAQVVRLDPLSGEAEEMRKVLAASRGSSGNGSP